MIIVRLWGGLCNQMFQYAFGYALANKNHDDVRFDVDFYLNQPGYVDRRDLEINVLFQIPGFETVNRARAIIPLQNRIISNITRRINSFQLRLPGKIIYYKEKKHKYNPSVVYNPNCINYYDGYWQTELYFKQYEEEIKNIFSYSEKTMAKVKVWLDHLNNQNTVALHIRRGDLSKGVGSLSENAIIDYYFRAIEYFNKTVNRPVFVVVSDNISWCKGIFHELTNIVYQENGSWSAVDDLCCISLCKHGIMSASTFSWWGNWLGASDGRVVVAPSGSYYNECFLPDRWTTI